MPQRAISRWKLLVFASVAIVLALVFLEGLLTTLWMVPDYLQRRRSAARAVTLQEDFHARHDPELGWVHIRGKQVADLYGPGRTITINADGFRALEDYVGRKPSARFRVVCLGDSMTMGYGVDDEATYPAYPVVQAVNMGQGGYSVGQCYLWYLREGPRLAPDALVATFILNDIWRMTNMRTPNGSAVPHFALSAGRLQVSGQPVPEKIEAGEIVDPNGGLLAFLFERSALFRSVGLVVEPVRDARTQVDQNQQFQVALAILTELRRQAGDVPMVLVILPEKIELQDPARNALYRQVTGVLVKFARLNNIPVLDMSAAFLAARNVEELYLDEQYHHLSEAGNRLVAERLDAFLNESVPGYPRRAGY
jgi:lysophospholipase L1-like esterase